MTNTVTLTVHETSFDNRLTMDFSAITYLRKGTTGTLVQGICEGRKETILVCESLRQIRERCAEKPIPCEEDKRDE